MFCYKCGAAITDKIKFCDKCGAKVITIEEEVVEEADNVKTVNEEKDNEEKDNEDTVNEASYNLAEEGNEEVTEEENEEVAGEEIVEVTEAEKPSVDEKTADEKPVKKKRDHIIGRIFMCLLIFVSLLCLFVSILCRSLLSKEVAETIAQSCCDDVYEMAFDVKHKGLDVPDYDDLDKDEKTMIRDMVTSASESLITWTFTGKGDPFDTDELSESFEDVYEAIMKTMYKNSDYYDEYDYDDFYDYYVSANMDMAVDDLENQLDDANDNLEEMFEDNFKDALKPVHFVFSLPFMIICIGITSLLVILFLILSKKKCFKGLGITGIIVGALAGFVGVSLMAVETSAVSAVEDLIGDDIDIKGSLIRSVVSSLTDALQMPCYKYAAIAAGSGLVLLIIGIILNPKKKNKK